MGNPRSLHLGVTAEAVAYLTAGIGVDLVGVANSGRSHVLGEVSLALLDAEWSVLRARGVADLRERPLEALAVAGLLDQVNGRAPSAVSGAVAAIEKSVRPGRTLLVLDDVDDLDTASSGAVVAAAARTGLVVLSASRPLPARLRNPHRLPLEIRPGVELQMPALGYVDTQTLLADLLPGPMDAATVTRIHSGAGGLPGLVTAIADNAHRNGRLVQVDGVWTASPDLWTPELAPSIAVLVKDLSPSALEGLEILSIAGPVDLPVARTLVPAADLEELDACRLLRFVARGPATAVGVYPQVVGAHYRHQGASVRRARFDDQLGVTLRAATSGAPGSSGTLGPVSPTAVADSVRLTRDEAPWESDTVRHRMLTEHWFRETVARRTRWEAHPAPETAVPYLQALLVGNSDLETLRHVVEVTPRTGEPRGTAALANWYALALAFVGKDLGAARVVLRAAREHAQQWAPLLSTVETHLSLLMEGAPDLDPVPVRTSPVEPDVADADATTRAEWHLFRGDPRGALTVLDGLSPDTAHFASSVQVLTGLALLLEARLDDALAWAQQRLAECREGFDVDALHGHAYVVSVVLLLQGRTGELREHLGSVLSTELTSSLQRPYQSANLSIAAGVAFLEGRPATARTLAGQAASLGLGLSPLPEASPTATFARLSADESSDGSADGADEPEPADVLWAEHEELRDRGYLVAAVSAGTHSIDLRPDPARARALLDHLARIPAGYARHAERFVRAVTAEDPGAGLVDGRTLVDAGQVFTGARTMAIAIRRLQTLGERQRAARAITEAVQVLMPYGPAAVGGIEALRPVADLTAREHEIARLAAAGSSNQELADRLHVSVRTVENHLNHAFRKLGVDGRGALARALGRAPDQASGRGGAS